MSANKIICIKNNIEYIPIRHAMCAGARTVPEIKEMAGVCGECAGCKESLEGILSSVCGCKGVSLETVVSATLSGCDTVEKVVSETGAGSGCGRCQRLIANIIEIGR